MGSRYVKLGLAGLDCHGWMLYPILLQVVVMQLPPVFWLAR
jgi:hypothetical protein